MDTKLLKDRAKDFLSGGRYLKALLYSVFVTLLSTNFLTYAVEDDKYYIGLSLITPIKEISAVTFQRLGLIFIFVVLFIVPMFTVSLVKFFMRDYSDMEKFNSQKFLSVDSSDYGNLIKIFLLRGIKIFLWSLLLLIPGIIKTYEYAMIPYILAEDSSLDSREVFETSKYMMDGNKMNLFLLGLSFIGWQIVGFLIPGSVFVINPYVQATHTQFYLELKKEKNISIV